MNGATIGVIGAGRMGQAVAGHLTRVGIHVIMCNSRGPASLAALAQRIGPAVTPGTTRDAADPELVFLAVPWTEVPEALSGVADWDGRILIDATNAVVPPDRGAADLGGRPSSEVVAGLAPGARLVKAFNTLRADLLSADPDTGGGRRVIFFSGDNERAKAQVERLIGRLGFAGIDLGRLGEGGRLQQFPGGPLLSLNLVRVE